MPFLVVLKRLEVWLLLAVVAGILGFAWRTRDPGTEPLPPVKAVVAVPSDPGGETVGLPEEKEVLVVSRVEVTASPGGRIVATTLEGRSPVEGDLVLDEGAVTATTDAGEPVNRFFEPFAETASLSAGEDSLATLRWWLPNPAEALWIEVKGRRLRAELP